MPSEWESWVLSNNTKSNNTFTTAEVNRLGLYLDPNGPDDQDILGHNDLKWSSIAITIQDSTSTSTSVSSSDKIVDVFDEFVQPQQQCEDNLVIQQLRAIDLVLQLEQDEKYRLPIYDDCEAMLLSNNYS